MNWYYPRSTKTQEAFGKNVTAKIFIIRKFLTICNFYWYEIQNNEIMYFEMHLISNSS